VRAPSAVELLLLLLNVGASFFMAGLIWVMQVVHYPLFALVGRAEFRAYEDAHTRRITWLVGPGMLLGLLSAGALVFVRPAAIPLAAPLAGLALLLVSLVSTALVQGPAHGRLGAGFDAAVHRRLVRSNWVRTAAWSAQALVAAFMLWRAAGG